MTRCESVSLAFQPAQALGRLQTGFLLGKQLQSPKRALLPGTDISCSQLQTHERPFRKWKCCDRTSEDSGCHQTDGNRKRSREIKGHQEASPAWPLLRAGLFLLWPQLPNPLPGKHSVLFPVEEKGNWLQFVFCFLLRFPILKMIGKTNLTFTFLRGLSGRMSFQRPRHG